MPINADIQMDPNQCGYGLPVDCCVGEGTGDPFAGGKSGGKSLAQQPSKLAPKGGDPYAGGK